MIRKATIVASALFALAILAAWAIGVHGKACHWWPTELSMLGSIVCALR